MRKRVTVPALVAIALAASAYAANWTVTFTAGQDTYIQTKLIPFLNAQSCAKYKQAPGCSSANLVTGGCVAQALSTAGYRACTIYTLDAAGETALNQDELNYRYVQRFFELNSFNVSAFKAACSAGNQTLQDAVCTAAGLSAGCNPCPTQTVP